MRASLGVLLLAATAAASGCTDRPADAAAAAAAAPPPSPPSIPGAAAAPDSFALAALEQFRARLAPAPVQALDSAAATSRDSLVERFVRAIERGDRAALADLAITPAEFAYLYYPSSSYFRPPTVLEADVVWMQIRESGRKGAARLFKQYGGRALSSYRGHSCKPRPIAEGENRIWECQVLLGADGVQLFGDILERGGRFKFVGYTNRL